MPAIIVLHTPRETPKNRKQIQFFKLYISGIQKALTAFKQCIVRVFLHLVFTNLSALFYQYVLCLKIGRKFQQKNFVQCFIMESSQNEHIKGLFFKILFRSYINCTRCVYDKEKFNQFQKFHKFVFASPLHGAPLRRRFVLKAIYGKKL